MATHKFNSVHNIVNIRLGLTKSVNKACSYTGTDSVCDHSVYLYIIVADNIQLDKVPARVVLIQL